MRFRSSGGGAEVMVKTKIKSDLHRSIPKSDWELFAVFSHDAKDGLNHNC